MVYTNMDCHVSFLYISFGSVLDQIKSFLLSVLFNCFDYWFLSVLKWLWNGLFGNLP